MKKSLLLLGLLASLNANANLINNGGFEDDDVSSGAAALFTSGSALSQWQNASASLLGTNAYAELRNNYVLSGSNPESPKEGLNLLELDTLGFNGGIQQTISGLTSGNQYELSFWYQSRNGAVGSYGLGSGGQNFSFSWFDGANTTTEIVSLTTNIDWTNITRTFTAGNTNILSFNALGGADGAGAGIDDISLVAKSVTTAVPEPETYGMMMLGLAMLGFASRRRKQ